MALRWDNMTHPNYFVQLYVRVTSLESFRSCVHQSVFPEASTFLIVFSGNTAYLHYTTNTSSMMGVYFALSIGRLVFLLSSLPSHPFTVEEGCNHKTYCHISHVQTLNSNNNRSNWSMSIHVCVQNDILKLKQYQCLKEHLFDQDVLSPTISHKPTFPLRICYSFPFIQSKVPCKYST